MKRMEDLVAAIDRLRQSDLEAWVREDLVAPHEEADSWVFSEMECARVRLICTLHYEMEVEAEALPVILSLVDELYETRQQLLSLSAAVKAQDVAVQEAIIAAMTRNPAPD